MTPPGLESLKAVYTPLLRCAPPSMPSALGDGIRNKKKREAARLPVFFLNHGRPGFAPNKRTSNIDPWPIPPHRSFVAPACPEKRRASCGLFACQPQNYSANPAKPLFAATHLLQLQRHFLSFSEFILLQLWCVSAVSPAPETVPSKRNTQRAKVTRRPLRR